MAQLRYIKHRDIDFSRWDSVIENAPNSRVYAFSWYLERVAENWDALIWGDYEFVMPITRRRKWGISYVFTPTFCQQLGVFPAPTVEIQSEFFTELSKKFRFVQIQVNSALHPDFPDNFSVTKRTNLILPLFETHDVLSANYTRHTIRNLSKAGKSGITVSRGMNVKEFINHRKEILEGDLKPSSYAGLEKLVSYGQATGNGFLLNAYTRYNELCASAFFLRAGNRVVYLSAFSTPEGKETSAMYAIVDRFIQEYATSGLLLDFEGSSIEGVARFYKGFAPHSETYFYLYCNNLIFPLNRLK